MSKKEHKAADYLAINPRGKVPAFRDGGFSLRESVAILLYLDRRFPEPPLFGRTPEESGRVLRHVLELINYFEPALDRMIIPIAKGQVGTPSEREAIKAAAQDVHREVARLESALQDAPFVAGASVSAADCTAFPFVQQLLRASYRDAARPLELGFLPLESKYPALAAWCKRVEALPGYERTYPPHWR
jgi:glutathione S-transferase